MNCYRTAKSGCENINYYSRNARGSHNSSYQILEKLPRSGYDQLGYLDDSMTQIQLKHEHEWSFKLQKYYPYHLHEKGSEENNNLIIDKVAIRKIFPPLPRTGAIVPARAKISSKS